MRPVLATARDAVRSQLWPLPVLGVILALAAGFGLPRLDAHVDDTIPGWLRGGLFGGDAGAARTVLDAVASSLITVTSLTFSLTVVTLQLASSQFSPRLLRTFTSDVFVQATLGVFLATFTYSLTALRAVRSGDDGGTPFVPRISVTVSFFLATVSVVALVLFLAHLARQIRVETMLRDVHRDASAVAESVLGEPRNESAGADPTPPHDAARVLAAASGFVTSIDTSALLRAVVDADAMLTVECRLGDSLVAGTPIGRVWSASDTADDAYLDQVRSVVGDAVRVGHERTGAQDIAYGLRQLVDVIAKALSPGINDPTTAVHAIGHVSALLCELSAHDLGPTRLTDDDRTARVLLARPDLTELLDLAMTQPRRYGKSDPLVLGRLFRLLEEVAWHVGEHPALVGQLSRLRATAGAGDYDDTERAQLEHAAARVTEAFASGGAAMQRSAR